MQPVTPVTPAMATVPSVITPVMTPTPPTVAPPPGVMPPSSPPGTENPYIDGSPPDSELLQPGRTRARTSVYHKATTAAGHADNALYNQRPSNSPPPLSTCHASKRLEPATYQETMDSEYSANWVYATNQELSGLQGAGSFGVAYQIKGGNVVSAKWVFTWKSDEIGKIVKAKARLVARKFSQRPGVDYNEANFCPNLCRAMHSFDGCYFMRVAVKSASF